MIDELDVNQKVGIIRIEINNNNNPINTQIIQNMVNNYDNVYWIRIFDRSD